MPNFQCLRSSTLLIAFISSSSFYGCGAEQDSGLLDQAASDIAASQDPDLNPDLIAERPFGLNVPDSYDGSPTPLLVGLHGLGGSGSQHSTLGGLGTIANQRGFLFAYPDGIKRFGYRAWNASCCDGLGLNSDDVTYLRAVIADIADRYSVDRKRIYIQGLSNGAFMAHLMACVASDLVAGIAPLSGTMWQDELDTCQPEYPVSVLHTHGTADATVAYQGGLIQIAGVNKQASGAVDVARHWAEQNGCSTGADSMSTEQFDAERTIDGDETEVLSYGGCVDHGAVQLWTIEGGSHIPYLSQPYIHQVLDFLLEHAKP